MLPAAAAFTALTVIWLLVAERTGSTARLVAKPLASGGFLAVAVAAGALDSGFGRWMLAGLVLAALGDVFLLGNTERAFLAGLGSFLAAQAVYGGAFVVRGISPAGLWAVIPLGMFALGVFRWLGPHLPERMRGPVAAYAVAISAMGVLAVATAVESWDARLPAGAFLFIVSDLAVARDHFVSPGFLNRLWGLPLYYGAQLLLAWGAGG